MIKVISSGIYTSIQDLGRKGFASMGIPLAGVMDSYAAKFSNLLLHNNENDAVVEITFGASKFEFLEDTVICISGADFSPQLNSEDISMNSLLKVKKGSVLTFGKRKYGVRSYLAIKGGFVAETVLKSKSYSKGITEKVVLKKGDIIFSNTNTSTVNINNAKVRFQKKYLETKTLEVSTGPEYELLLEKQRTSLKNNMFTISSSNSRMGYILEEKLENDFLSMYSSGVLPGTIQLTPSGKLIILMRDCQVTGGYPRVLQLSEQAINTLAQKTTGEKIQFKIKMLYKI